MRTKEQLRDIVASRLENKIFEAFGFDDLVAAMSGATAEQKQILVDLLITGSTDKAGDLLLRGLKIKAKQASIIQADAFLLDDSLSLEELDKII